MQIINRIKAKFAEVTGAVTEENLFFTIIIIAIVTALVIFTKSSVFVNLLGHLVTALFDFFLSKFNIG